MFGFFRITGGLLGEIGACPAEVVVADGVSSGDVEMQVRDQGNANRTALSVIPGQQDSQDAGSPRRSTPGRQVTESEFAACIVLID